MWKRPFGASSCWFLLNRYLSVLSNVAVSVFQLADVRKTLCADAVMYHQVLLIAAQVIVCSAWTPPPLSV